MRRLAGYLLLLVALGSILPGAAFLLFSLAIGADFRITEPLPLIIAGTIVKVLMFWGAWVLFSPKSDKKPVAA